MQTDVVSHQCPARQMWALVAPLAAAAVLAASLLAVWHTGPLALSQQKTQAVESPANNGAGSGRVMPSALEPALRDLDGVVHHG